MSQRIPALAMLLVTLIGCSVSEQDFPDEYAQTYCNRANRCDAHFDDIYDDKAECRDAAANTIETVMDLGGVLGCDYDPAKGGACLRAMQRGTCADFLDGEHGDACEDLCADD